MIHPTTQGAVHVLSIDGTLNEEEAERLAEKVAAMPRAGRPQLVLDLANVSLIDSAGCEALLNVRDTIHQLGGAVHLAALSPLCHDILTATGVIRFFPTFACDNQAVSHFAK